VWRRWDLHVHTPASSRTQLGNPVDPATWSAFGSALFAAAERHDIAAICLSDYFTLDGYRQLISAGIYDPSTRIWRCAEGERPLSVIPGVELRLSNLTVEGNAVNIHVIFDPARLSETRLADDFLGSLALDPQHGGQTLRATREHLLSLGKAHLDGTPPNLNQSLVNAPLADQARFWDASIEGASVSLPELQKALQALDDSVPGGRAYLIVVANSGHGGLHEFPWQGHHATVRQSLIRQADLLFSSNPHDRDFLLGRKDSTPPAECIARFGRLKACVWGSDSKEYSTLLHPSAGATSRYTWIKAEATFEGLKQLIYEPEHRVAIQETIPDDRPWNTIVDSVRFLDDSKSGFASEDWIPLSQALTAVIGGKSSGKSLLLHLIAKTIDPTQVRDRAGSGKRPYDLIEQDISFQVRWKNGDVQTLGGVEVAPSRITYLPQSYINQLAEPDSHEQLADVILRLLREEETFATADTQLRREIEQHRAVVSGQLQKLFDLKRQVTEASDRIETLGKESAIEAEILRLQQEQDEIRRSAGLSPEEEQAFSQLRSQLDLLDLNSQERGLGISAIGETSASLSLLQERISSDIAAIGLGSPNDAPANSTQAFLKTELEKLDGELSASVTATLTSLAAERARLGALNVAAQDERLAVEKKLEPYQARLEGRDRAAAAAEAEAKQKQLLSDIREELKRRDRLNTRIDDAVGRLLQAYQDIHDSYNRFVEEHLSGGTLEIAADVRLRASIGFDGASFWSTFQEGLDGRQKVSEFRSYRETEDRYVLGDLSVHLKDLEAALRDLVGPDSDRKLRIRRAYSPDSVAGALLRDHFGLALSLEHEGDDLQRMSPGKRGMVLLRLLLERSDATHPILIDQPEDNLDNRTVFSQLRHAVRARKRHRQIIVVSHNANLVVSTDAECVVVAHQYGPGERPDGLPRFEYTSGALEFAMPRNDSPSVLRRQGVREHVCEVLEGGEQAFRDRQEKYEFSLS
jgi:hypothetical protein